MYNWSINTKRLTKDKRANEIWSLQNMINFGLDGDKLDMEQLKKYFGDLVIDPSKKAYLEFALYGKKPSYR